VSHLDARLICFAGDARQLTVSNEAVYRGFSMNACVPKRTLLMQSLLLYRLVPMCVRWIHQVGQQSLQVWRNLLRIPAR